MAVQHLGLSSKSQNLWGLVPEGFKLRLARLWCETLGAGLTAAGLFFCFALASYNVNDPSANTATDATPLNWLGYPGAYSADTLMQGFGAASYGIAASFVLLGLRLILLGRWPFSKKQSLRRAALWVGAIMLLSTGLAAAEAPDTWPLMTGLGGLTGYALAQFLFSLGAAIGLPPFELWLMRAGSTLGVLGIIYALRLYPRSIGAAWDMLCLWGFVARESAERFFTWLTEQRPEQEVRGSEPLKPTVWARLTSALSFSRNEKAPSTRSEPLVSYPPRHALDEDTPQPQSSKTTQAEAAARLERTHGSSAKIVRSKKKTRAGRREKDEAQPTLDLEPLDDYQLPPLNLLAKPKKQNLEAEITDDALEQNARMLESVLEDFGIRGEIIRVRPGPVVTLYELEPAAGIKSSRVIGLADDIARSMSAISARVAVVPGRNVIGIELPNSQRETVFLRELLAAPEYENTSSKLALALGKNIGGESVIADLATMPHLLIAGTTGSGKSVGINTMILSLLYRMSPHQCKLILIDPKMLELSVYDGIPHLLAPVVTEPKKAVVALKWVVREMEDRYRNMSKLGVRNISGYNARVIEAQENEETLTRTVQTGFDKETGTPIYEQEDLPLEPMPFIVVVVDEMADLMMVAGKDIEGAVQRLAQMARAAGIHLITATQRPSVDVITGTIKANFPTRISFQVTSKIDSRTILGEQGSEQLLGQGDMLYMAGGGRIRRVHGPFVSDDEVEKVVRFLKKQGAPEYLEEVTADQEGEEGFNLLSGSNEGDELYNQAVHIVATDGKASTSYIQRRLQIGYNRAARIVEQMEEEGIISPANHAGKREVLIGEHAHR